MSRLLPSLLALSIAAVPATAQQVDSSRPPTRVTDSTAAPRPVGGKGPRARRPAAAPAAPRPAPTWPVVGPPPRPGALLPGKRLVTFYGNPLSERMGILGRLGAERMMDSLEAQSKAWEKADPGVPVVRALELVATVGSHVPGPGELYRTRMPDTLITRVIGWARSRGWHTILDVQVGFSTPLAEVERLVPFLAQPDVHLALDPEFDMPPGKRPGTVIGTTDAADVNAVIARLGQLVDERKLPPKVLLVHRFTKKMLTNASKIRLDPRVQVAIVMDGFGSPSLKRGSWDRYVYDEPVQFTGIKLFYHHLRVRDNPVLGPAEVLRYTPKPNVIIYQ